MKNERPDGWVSVLCAKGPGRRVRGPSPAVEVEFDGALAVVSNLHQGAAQETGDPKIVRAAIAHPGVVCVGGRPDRGGNLRRDRIPWEWSSTCVSRHRRLRQGRLRPSFDRCSGSALGPWEAAQIDMGEVPAAAVVACILQRGAEINSAGGYLRGLTRKSEVGEFSLGPILLAQINSRRRNKKRA